MALGSSINQLVRVAWSRIINTYLHVHRGRSRLHQVAML